MPESSNPTERFWRIGRSVGRTIYVTRDDRRPRKSDKLIGVMDTKALAQAAVASHNAAVVIGRFNKMVGWS